MLERLPVNPFLRVLAIHTPEFSLEVNSPDTVYIIKATVITLPPLKSCYNEVSSQSKSFTLLNLSTIAYTVRTFEGAKLFSTKIKSTKTLIATANGWVTN